MPQEERAIVVYGAGESQLLPLMDENVAKFPMLKLFSLPSFMPDGGRRIELGVKGDPAHVDAGLAHLRAGVEAGGFRWEPWVPYLTTESSHDAALRCIRRPAPARDR